MVKGLRDMLLLINKTSPVKVETGSWTAEFEEVILLAKFMGLSTCGKNLAALNMLQKLSGDFDQQKSLSDLGVGGNCWMAILCSVVSPANERVVQGLLHALYTAVICLRIE